MILSLFYVGKVKIEDEKTLTAVFFFIVFINSVFLLFWSFRIAPFLIQQIVWFVRKYILRRKLNEEEIQIEEVQIEVLDRSGQRSSPHQTKEHQAEGKIKKEKELIRNPLNFMRLHQEKFDFFEDSAVSLQEIKRSGINDLRSEIEGKKIEVQDQRTKKKTKVNTKKKKPAMMQKDLN